MHMYMQIKTKINTDTKTNNQLQTETNTELQTQTQIQTQTEAEMKAETEVNTRADMEVKSEAETNFGNRNINNLGQEIYMDQWVKITIKYIPNVLPARTSSSYDVLAIDSKKKYLEKMFGGYLSVALVK